MSTEIFQNHQPEYLTLPPIHTKSGTIRAGMTTRNGGYSTGRYSSLNFGYHVGDDPVKVTQNRRRLGELIGLAPENWIGAEQVHGHAVTHVTHADKGKGALDIESAISGMDGLFTDSPDVLLTACFADCTPLFFWSESQPVVGIAHAGWKGTTGEIAAVMVQKITETFGLLPSDLEAAIGPTIGSCCYEVDERVAERVRAISGIHHPDVLMPKAKGHYRLNLPLLNKQILIRSGLPEAAIHMSGLCTSCHTDLFYSHRKEGAPTGRMMGYIGIFSGD